MNAKTHLMLLVLAIPAAGCSYNQTYTFANTRKLLESDALGITKVGFSPLLVVYETAVSPVTTYMDAGGYAEGKDHVYLSYLGMQTIISSNMHGFYKFFASLLILPVDTVWFPVAGLIDTIYVINRPDPQQAKPEPKTAAPEDPHPRNWPPVPSSRTSPRER